ncbi:MAG: bifunctional 4-hydroxy-2-oxoglutarate aldolase/2-dehydro-3-deoxy-phosphogluconate aldolase [Christensenellaceae bacterium]|jgi:2-dehydro-3-deoxyphosphogluconate aldolase/(4S)-4-hydroxy-2-oxoglutarate aldolase|nr:bifunctional 4-hydroxy-2-oxoglutarate aldolase/2-dehydro-3-deoxy-phosphogluconate aldolase [Christensenellaceae bacterium]
MTRANVFRTIDENKLVGVIRGASATKAIELANHLVKNGVKIIEITFTTPKAYDAIATLSEKYLSTEVLIGAGTVLDAQTARIAILNGAEFIVTPSVCLDVVKICNRYSTAVIPGIQTPTDLISVLEYGIDFVKLFPSNIMTLKSLRGPFPNVKFMATGGISKDNLRDWLDAGVNAVGAGSELCMPDADIGLWLSIIAKQREKDNAGMTR